MSLPILKTCKKRKKDPKLYGFHAFCDPGNLIKPTGAFRDNIRAFLQECAEVEDYQINSMPVWCTLLVLENRGIVIPLYTIEENVKSSENPFCDHCRCTGWSQHYLSKRKYHVIIPLDSEWNKPLKSDVFELQNHLLYGLFHCNGFGHLLCINGIEGGSKYLCGREIMDLWDRICTNLQARKITVEDTSRKRLMDLRLLYGIAYGHPWFGKWGYKFDHGSFGVQESHYQKAVEILGSVDLDDLVLKLPKTDQRQSLKYIISSYRDMSDTCLITLRDLLRFMLTLKSQTPARTNILVKVRLPAALPSRYSTRTTLQNRYSPAKAKMTKCRKFASLIASMDSRWPTRRLEYAAEVIVNVLKENKESKSTTDGMTRQEVRDAARLHIGDTGLLDYVLKSMNHVIVGNLVVRRRINPMNRVLEYTIHNLGEASPTKPKIEHGSVEPVSAHAKTPRSDVYRDVYALYQQVLLGQPESEAFGLSIRVILDSKHFVKEWPFMDHDDQLLRFICRLLPTTSDELDMEFSRNFFPGELIVLPLHASFVDLKLAAQNALRDTYCIMENYVVSDIENLDSFLDQEAVFSEVESGVELWVRGSGIDYDTELKYEGGPDNWTVRCSCGAKDDDGERMVSCDICEVWQHTRCRGIEDSEAVPPLFVCHSCCSSLMPSKVETTSFFESSQDLTMTPKEVEEPLKMTTPEVEEPWMMMAPVVEEPWMMMAPPVEEPWMMMAPPVEEPWMLLQY